MPKNLQAATLVVVALLGFSTLASGNAITDGNIESLWSRVDWKKEVSPPVNAGGEDTWNIHNAQVPRRFLAEETDDEFYRPVVEVCATVRKFDVLVKGGDAKRVAGYLRKQFASEAGIDKDQVEAKSRQQKDKRGNDMPDAKCSRKYDDETTRVTLLVTTTELAATEKVEKLLSTMKKPDVLTSMLRSQGSLRICAATVSKANTKHLCQKKKEEETEEAEVEEEEQEEAEQELDSFEIRALAWLKALLASDAPLPTIP